MKTSEYRAIRAINWSSLKPIEESPKMYKWRLENPRPDTPSLALGRAIHTAILEPKSFGSRYAVKPVGLDLRTTKGRQWKEENGNVEILSETQMGIVGACNAAVSVHAPAMSLLEGTRREEVVQWTDSATGMACKARLDAIAPTRTIELKTTRDLSRFERDVAKFLYHGQFAFYLDGALKAGVVDAMAESYVIAVETKEPFDCAAFLVPYHVIEAGRALYENLISMLSVCNETNMWPGRHPSITNLELPRWAAGLEEEKEF